MSFLHCVTNPSVFHPCEIFWSFQICSLPYLLPVAAPVPYSLPITCRSACRVFVPVPVNPTAPPHLRVCAGSLLTTTVLRWWILCNKMPSAGSHALIYLMVSGIWTFFLTASHTTFMHELSQSPAIKSVSLEQGLCTKPSANHGSDRSTVQSKSTFRSNFKSSFNELLCCIVSDLISHWYAEVR